MNKTFFTCIILLLCSMGVIADSPAKFYAGGSIGQTQSGYMKSGMSQNALVASQQTNNHIYHTSNNQRTGFKIFLAHRFNEYIIGQVNYVDFGDFKSKLYSQGASNYMSAHSLDTRAAMVNIIFQLPLFDDVIGLYINAGAGVARTFYETRNVTGKHEEYYRSFIHSTGIGFRVNLSSKVRFHMEADHYNFKVGSGAFGKSKANTYTAGLSFRF